MPRANRTVEDFRGADVFKNWRRRLAYNPDEQDDDSNEPDDWQEFVSLRSLLEEASGRGGDEQWRGDWYPITLIRDSYFREYAEQLAEDIGAVTKNASWPNNFIDWDAAADALKQDYTSFDWDDESWWAR